MKAINEEYYLVMAGDCVPMLADFVHKLWEDGLIHPSTIDGNVFWFYHHVLRVTFVRFKGRDWAHPLLTLLKSMSDKGSCFLIDSRQKSEVVTRFMPDIVKTKAPGQRFMLPNVGDLDDLVIAFQSEANEDPEEVHAKVIEVLEKRNQE